jgi:hypothetical protein
MINTCYVPHGINSEVFRPIVDGDVDYEEFKQFEREFKTHNDVEFIVFWNNRNVRRKKPGDVLLSFRAFCDKLPEEQAQKVALLIHSDIVDVNGTDLMAVKRAVVPKYKVIFSDQKIHPKIMNFYYNVSDVTLNIADNEGFGLSGAESVMAGTMIVSNVTGGLQDQMRFEDKDGNWIELRPNFPTNHAGTYKKHGSWAKPVFPVVRTLQGSPQTPYIFADHVNFDDVARVLYSVYRLKPETREQRGLEGREWMLSVESGMSSKEMCRRMVNAINHCIDNFQKRERFILEEVKEMPPIPEDVLGIVWPE